MTDPTPIACDLSVLDPQQQMRHAELWRQAKACTTALMATEHGVAFHFVPDTQLAHDLIELLSRTALLSVSAARCGLPARRRSLYA